MKADFFCLESFLDCIQRHGTSRSMYVCVCVSVRFASVCNFIAISAYC